MTENNELEFVKVNREFPIVNDDGERVGEENLLCTLQVNIDEDVDDTGKTFFHVFVDELPLGEYGTKEEAVDVAIAYLQSYKSEIDGVVEELQDNLD